MSSQESIESKDEQGHGPDTNEVEVVALTKENLEQHKQYTEMDSKHPKLKRYYDCIRRWQDATEKDECERLVKRVRLA